MAFRVPGLGLRRAPKGLGFRAYGFRVFIGPTGSGEFRGLQLEKREPLCGQLPSGVGASAAFEDQRTKGGTLIRDLRGSLGVLWGLLRCRA